MRASMVVVPIGDSKILSDTKMMKSNRRTIIETR